jgi:hypothetical protein
LAKNDIQNDSYAPSAITVNKRENREERRKLNEADASVQVKQQFIVDFGYIPVDALERTGTYDEATFKKNGQVFTAFYDDESTLVGTSSIKTFADLPLKAQNYINKKYAGYSVNGVMFFDDNEFNDNNAILYNQLTDSEDSYFVELKKETHAIVVQVDMNGLASFFASIR